MLAVSATLRSLLLIAAIVYFFFWIKRRTFPSTVARTERSLVDCTHYGTQLIDDGCHYFPDWSASMLREFDDWIKPDLPRLFEIASDAAESHSEQWSTVIEGRLSNSSTQIVADQNGSID